MVSLLVDARIAAAEAAAYERVRAICERLGLSCAHFALAEIDALITDDQQSALDAVIAETEVRVREECARIADVLQLPEDIASAIRNPVDST